MERMNMYYREQIDEGSRLFYDGLLKNISDLAQTGSVQLYGSFQKKDMDKACKAYYALRADRPEFYFMGREVHVHIHNGSSMSIALQPRYTSLQIHRINKLLIAKVNETLKKNIDGADYWKEWNIYTKVVNDFVYEDGEFAHDVTGPVVYGRGVCEAIAGFLVIVLREAGIPAIRVFGTAKGGKHCWVMVWINGRPYHLDPTWDLKRAGMAELHKYFNLSVSEIGRDHVIDDNWLDNSRSKKSCV